MLTTDWDVRKAKLGDAEGIARVYVDTWRDAYAGIIPTEYLATLDVDKLAKFWKGEIRSKKTFVLVAESGGDVVGFASGGLERDDDPFLRAEIFTLYVRPDAQGAGVGAHLLIEMLRLLEDRWPVLVWVLEENAPARAFYEAMGAVPVRRRVEPVGGKPLEQVGYAFFDVG